MRSWGPIQPKYKEWPKAGMIFIANRPDDFKDHTKSRLELTDQQLKNRIERDRNRRE